MGLLSCVRRTIAEHDLARPATRVAVAISGGPDSVALAHVVAALASEGTLTFAGLAHFNHQLRPTAGRDEDFCRELAVSLAQPIHVGRGDVAAMARRDHRSLEDAAHHARHAFFDEARQALAADVVAVGHTRDDQAETFLLRLLRGAGARGLAAMHPRSGAIVRPLLDCRRAEVLGWLRERELRYVVDETNADRSIPRNRVRADLLPLLASGYNPAIVDVLADAAELARGEWLWLEGLADALLADVATVADGRIEIDRERLAAEPVGAQRAVLWRAMSRLTSHPVGFEHVRSAIRLLTSTGPAEIDAPGQILKRVGAGLVLTSGARKPSAGRTEANLFEYPLSIPGEVLVPEAGLVFTAEEPPAVRPGAVPAAAAGLAAPGVPGGAVEAVVRRDLCGSCLSVRNRRPGDRLKLDGRRGSRKLQDLLVDARIERARRDRIPVVVAENGRILCVAGFGIAEEFRVTDPAQRVVILRFKVLGGPA